jgi:hypothetical protein
MGPTTLKTSMPTSSIRAQRPAIVKHIGTSRRHCMKISAASAPDTTEVRPFYNLWKILFSHVQNVANFKGISKPHQPATVPNESSDLCHAYLRIYLYLYFSFSFVLQ